MNYRWRSFTAVLSGAIVSMDFEIYKKLNIKKCPEVVGKQRDRRLLKSRNK